MVWSWFLALKWYSKMLKYEVAVIAQITVLFYFAIRYQFFQHFLEKSRVKLLPVSGWASKFSDTKIVNEFSEDFMIHPEKNRQCSTIFQVRLVFCHGIAWNCQVNEVCLHCSIPYLVQTCSQSMWKLQALLYCHFVNPSKEGGKKEHVFSK